MLGLKTKRLVGAFKIRLSFTEWFGTAIINNFYNYLAPKSGTAIVGVYFKNRHNLHYRGYVSLLITSGMITVLASGILGFLASLFMLSKLSQHSLIFIMFYGFMIIVPLALFWVPKVHFPIKKIKEKINRFLEGWNVLRKDKRLLSFLFLMDACTIILMAMRYYIMLRMLSVDVNFMKCIVISPFNIIVHVATLVPGAYGIKEAAVGLVSQLTGMGFSSGMLATLSDRIVVMTLTFILGPIFSLILMRKGLNIKGVEKP